MIILDANVVSETIRAEPDPSVASWIASQPASALFVTTVTQAELLYGLNLLPPGRRRGQLTDAVGAILHNEFSGRILPFDSPSAEHYASVTAARRTQGPPISAFDAQMAAIARSRGAQAATGISRTSPAAASPSSAPGAHRPDPADGPPARC